MTPFTCLEYACWALTLGAPLAFGAHWLCRHPRRAAHVLAGAGPWLVSRALHPWALRGRTMPPRSPHHPAGKAAPGRERPLSGDEARALAGLEDAWNLPAVPDSGRLSPRGEG